MLTGQYWYGCESGSMLPLELPESAATRELSQEERAAATQEPLVRPLVVSGDTSVTRPR